MNSISVVRVVLMDGFDVAQHGGRPKDLGEREKIQEKVRGRNYRASDVFQTLQDISTHIITSCSCWRMEVM